MNVRKNQNLIKIYWANLLLILIIPSMQGCLLAAAGAGAEAGYVLTQDDRSASETVNDQRITTTVKSKLIADSRVAGLDINVDTFKSEVTLRGAVRSDKEKQAAINLAKEVSGVKTVHSKLVVVH